MDFVFSQDDLPEIQDALLLFVRSKIACDFDPQMIRSAGVLCENGRAVMVYSDLRPGQSCMVHIAGEGNWLSRTAMGVFLAYPFLDLKVRRVTGLIEKSNKRSRKLAEWLGFKYEGCLRRAGPDGSNVILYGLLPEEYRWPEDLRDDERQPTAA